MIAWLEGVLRAKEPTRAVLDVRGVGYELQIPLSTFAALPDVGKTVALHVHTILRQDALTLYGFATAAERSVFELLLRANRVGPRLAQTLLSGMPAERLLAALHNGEVEVLRRAPGVGAKTAERIAVELRERAGELAALLRAGSHEPGEPSSEVGALDEVLSALVNLGYPRSQAERVAQAVAREAGEEAALEERIRLALRRLSP